MFGIRYFKSRPTSYILQVRNGRIRREGAGLSFYYYAPASSIVSVPVSSRVDDFIHTQTTADFQTVTVQGRVTWRIAEPKKTAALVDFTLRADGKAFESDDATKLPQRVLARVENLTQKLVQQRSLKQALLAADAIAAEGYRSLATHPELQALGLEILGFVVTAVRPTPETARALEAEAREAILKGADDAIFLRRNAAVENERAIRASELDTEIAVEQKKRQIKETQMDAEASLRSKKADLRRADMETDIGLEERRRSFVDLNAQNTRTLAEADAHKVAAVMAALEKADTRIVQALAAAGMAPGQLIAQAFGGIAERAEKIGQLNVSPDLLESLLAAAAPAEPKGRRAQ
jgi:hypothetical protein